MSTVEPAISSPVSPVEPLDEHNSAVRFETQCVVIPDLAQNSRRPRLTTKSYALPLWKRRASSASPSTSAPPEDASFEQNQSHLVLQVPYPIFSPKPRSMARSVDDTPLLPCLVHRPQSSGPSCPSAMLTRYTRTPRKSSPSPSRSDITTVPLRPCCTACQSATEAALADGDAWTERFSRAAMRRRSVSDGGLRTITVAGSAASASYGELGVSINVDEVDKRRRCSSTTLRSNCTKVKEENKMLSVPRGTTTFNSSAADPRSPSSSTHITPATPRIPEEEGDERELFPLPYPKRTPTTSSSPSPAVSLSSLTVSQANQLSVPSPTPSACSGASTSTSEQPFLTPCSSSSCLCLLTTNLTSSEDPPRPPSPHLLSTLPSLSGRRRTRPLLPRAPFIPPPSDTLPSATDSILPKTPRSREPVPKLTRVAPSSPDSQQPSPHHSPIHKRLPWRTKRSVSADIISRVPSSNTTPPPTSLTLSAPVNRMKSFSISSTRHIVEAVIRGVGAMGPGGVGLGVMAPGSIGPGV